MIRDDQIPSHLPRQAESPNVRAGVPAAVAPAERPTAELWVCHLGSVPYRDAVTIQEQLRGRREREDIPDTLLLLEHPPVYTRGRRSQEHELALGEAFYRDRGIEIVPTNRGGKVTYHGPGQLVGYPIMRTTDVLRHVRTIEDALVTALAQEGIHARSRPEDGPDYTGVWVEDRKIASLGVHVARGVSTHGFAINVENDLTPFTWVHACGLPDVTMTSVERELIFRSSRGSTAGLPCFRKRVAVAFAEVHGLRQRLVSPARLGIEAPLAPAPAAGRDRRSRTHAPALHTAHADDLQIKAAVPA